MSDTIHIIVLFKLPLILWLVVIFSVWIYPIHFLKRTYRDIGDTLANDPKTVLIFSASKQTPWQSYKSTLFLWMGDFETIIIGSSIDVSLNMSVPFWGANLANQTNEKLTTGTTVSGMSYICTFDLGLFTVFVFCSLHLCGVLVHGVGSFNGLQHMHRSRSKSFRLTKDYILAMVRHTAWITIWFSSGS